MELQIILREYFTNIYDGKDNPKIDTTNMSVEETACKVLEILKSY